MLAALQAHSRALMGLDGPDEAESSKQALQRQSDNSSDVDDDGDEAEEFQSDDGWGADDGFVTDSEEDDLDEQDTREADTKVARVPEVVFAPQARSGTDDALSKAERKAFMVSCLKERKREAC